MLLMLFIAFAGFSCKKPGYVMDTIVQLHVVNQQSENLVANSAILNYDNIEVYHVNNGEKTLVNNVLMAFAKGFLIGPLEGDTTVGLRVTPNVGTLQNKPVEYRTTLIKLGDLGVDTIRCEVICQGGTLLAVRKVWYNSELKWDQKLNTGSTHRQITIIKK